MDAVRSWASVALLLAVLCSSARSGIVARESATGSITGRVHVVSHPARRLATAGVYPGRIVGIQSERETSVLEHVIVIVNSPMRVVSTPQRATTRQTHDEV